MVRNTDEKLITISSGINNPSAVVIVILVAMDMLFEVGNLLLLVIFIKVPFLYHVNCCFIIVYHFDYFYNAKFVM